MRSVIACLNVALTVLAVLAALPLGRGSAQGAPDEPSANGPPIKGELFPVCYQDGKYHVTAGFPHVMIYTFTGDRRRAREAWLVLDLPYGFELIGASPWLPTRITDNARRWDPERVTYNGRVDIDGKPCSRRTIAIHPNLLRIRPDSVSWGYRERVYIRTWPGLGPRKVTARWKLITRDYEGPEHPFTIEVLPRLTPPPRKLDRFKVMICKYGQATAPFASVREAYFDYWRSLHNRPYTTQHFGWKQLSDETRERIKRQSTMVLFTGAYHGGTPRLRFAKWLSCPPLVKADGPEHGPSICPSYLIDDPDQLLWDKYALVALREKLRDVPSARVIGFDFEPGAMDFCFCDTCRAKFAAAAKLKAVPTVKQIRSQYSSQWFDFRVQQNSAIHKRYVAAVRKVAPKMPYWICTDNLHDGAGILSGWCGCDERLFDPDVDVHLPMIYYSGLAFYKDCALNVKLLNKPVFPLIDPAERLEMFHRRYTPPKVKQNIVAAAANGCMGLGFWPQDDLDGAYLTNIAEGAALVAQGEDYYFAKRDDNYANVEIATVFNREFSDGDRSVKLSIPEFGENLQYNVHRNRADCLVSVFNYDETRDALVRIKIPSLPDGPYRVTDLGTGEVYTDAARKSLPAATIRSGFLAKVERNGVIVLEIAAQGLGAQALPQTVFEKELAAMRSSHGDVRALNSAQEGEAAATWGDVEGDGTAEVKLVLPGAHAYVRVGDAAVVGWTPSESAGDALMHADRGFLGQVELYAPGANAAALRFKPAALRIENGSPTAVLSATLETDVTAAGADPNARFPLDGLRIEKRIVLADGGTTLRQSWSLTNCSPVNAVMPVGFRVKNLPRLSPKGAEGKPLPSLSTIWVETPQGRQRLTAAEKDKSFFLLPGLDDHPFRAKLKGAPARAWRRSPIVLRAGAEELVFEPDPDLTAGVYCWWGVSAFTIEPLTRAESLAPAKTLGYELVIRHRAAAK